MDIFDKVHLWIGMNVFSWTLLSDWMKASYPTISWIAVTTAAIIGIHTIFCMLFKCKPSNHKNLGDNT